MAESSFKTINLSVLGRQKSTWRMLSLCALACLGLQAGLVYAQFNDGAFDIATIAQQTGFRSDAFITSQQSLISRWSQQLGPGREFGFLSGNFSGPGQSDAGDDIAAICFNPDPRGNGHVLVTQSPGNQSGVLWQRALGDNSQYTFYVLPGDFDGDGASDLATLYYGSTVDAAQDARVKITYGSFGSNQTVSPTFQFPTGNGIDWRLNSGRAGAFLSGDFIRSVSPVNSLGRDDLAVITRDINNYTVRFYRGPDGSQVGSPVWSFSGGLPVAFRAGNFNADADIDIAYVYLNEQNQYQIRLLLGPNGTTSSLTNVGFPAGAVVKTFLAGDFDNDGLFDLAGVYNLNGVNQALVFFGANFLRPPALWQLRSDISTSGFSFLSGQFGTSGGQETCLDGIFDRCGVCNGDGTSCLGCIVTNNSARLSSLYDNLILQRDLYARALRALVVNARKRDAVRYKKTIRQARRDLKDIDARYGTSITAGIFQPIPTVSLNCANQQFCISSDISEAVNNLEAFSMTLHRGSELSYAKCRRVNLSPGANNNARRRVERARRVRTEAQLNISSLPSFNSVCS